MGETPLEAIWLVFSAWKLSRNAEPGLLKKPGFLSYNRVFFRGAGEPRNNPSVLRSSSISSQGIPEPPPKITYFLTVRE
ncbi:MULTISPECIES: hypothetical protein [Oscillatoriales]|jgi:hypothetical protein|uniref:hypothetical protein n=1 Tax=Limnospira TaxID=2596745 RepID=UPI0001D0F025|nr:hypothetical protein [Arthrospira platensis]MBD2575288.1 hypothetical protein [Arthrospira platensis FACHB-971]MBD2671543.1 hypothetical protein [Arthrospira platensis FACHB-439]MBD2712471.1 hypothetical protein [Arthrospira platensis FACHB-835]BAI94312.1 hypothetical protein NIES39_R00030 [Arthrospira platensis NIES-39]